MKRLTLLLLILSGAAFAQYLPQYGYCQSGGSGIASPVLLGGTPVQRYMQQSYPSCVVTVYNSDGVTVSTIYSNSTGTPLSNPFTANYDGSWVWFAASGSTYYVQLSSGGLPAPVLTGPYSLSSGSGSGGAPATNSYFVATTPAGLTGSFQNLGLLTTGLMKMTVAAGVATISTATPGTDYIATYPGDGVPLVSGGVWGTSYPVVGVGTSLVAASALGVAGNCVDWGAQGIADTGSPCGSGGGGAPTSNPYIVAGTSAGLTGAFQNLGILTSGVLKISVSGGTATVATAVPNTDYVASFPSTGVATVAGGVWGTSYSVVGSGASLVAASALGTSGHCVQWASVGIADTGSPCSGSGAGYPSGTGFAIVSGGTAWGTTLTDPLPIAHGGTGSTTAANALIALGAAPTANPAFVGSVQVPVTGYASNCLQANTFGVISGTGSPCGSGGSGLPVNNPIFTGALNGPTENLGGSSTVVPVYAYSYTVATDPHLQGGGFGTTDGNLYYGTHDIGTLAIFQVDINPPIEVGTLFCPTGGNTSLYPVCALPSTPSTYISMYYAEGIAKKGNYVYLAICGASCGSDSPDSSVLVVDIRVPATPKIVAQVPYSTTPGAGVDSPECLQLVGSHLYVGSYTSSSGPADITSIDVSNPLSPVIDGYIVHTDLRLSVVLAIQGSQMLVSSRPGNGWITRIDLPTLSTCGIGANCTAAIIGTDPFQDGAACTAPTGIAVWGKYAIVACQGTSALDVLDVGGTAITSVYRQTSFVSSPSNVAVVGNLLYVTNLASNGVQVFHIGGPSLTYYGTLSTSAITGMAGSYIDNLVVWGRLAIVDDAKYASGFGGIYILDLLNGIISSSITAGSVAADDVLVRHALTVDGPAIFPQGVSGDISARSLVLKDTATGTCYQVKVTSGSLGLSALSACPTF